MSAFDWHNTVSVPGRTARRAFVWLAAALALANAATALRAGRQQHRFADGVEGNFRQHHRQVRVEERSRQSASRLRHREPPADRARFPRHRQRARRHAAGDRRSRPAQPQRDPVREPDARRLQPQQAADVFDAGGRQRGARHPVRPERAARRQDAGRGALRRGASDRCCARAARRRLPPRRQRRRARRRRPVRQRHRHRHPPAGQEPDRRLHQDEPAAQPRAAARRPGLRHADRRRRHVQPGRQHAHGDRAEGTLGAFRLPDRQPVHPRSARRPGGSEQAGPGRQARLQGREAVAQLPERRSALGAAGDRRFHRPQHHHQRHGRRQPDAAPEGHPVGSGARHHHADQGPRHAQERQRRSDRAARGARAEGEAAAGERAADRAARAARDRDVPAQLHEGDGFRALPREQPAAAFRRGGRADGHHRRPGLDHLGARRA